MPKYRAYREENGYGRLRVEEVPPYRPTREEVDAALSSLSKAHPFLVKHANHIDGEFDLALDKVRRMFDALLTKAVTRE